MKVRSLLIATGIVSSILGATVAYLVLTVPNDVAGEALLKKARGAIADGRNDDARASLAKVLQQYPRTDAAAAATVALVTLGDQERQKLANAVARARRETSAQKQQLEALSQKVSALAAAPAPSPVTVTAPAPAKHVKPAAHKKRSRHKRRKHH